MKTGLLTICAISVSSCACAYVEPSPPAERQESTSEIVKGTPHRHEEKQDGQLSCSRLYGVLTAADTGRPLRRGSLVRALYATNGEVGGQTAVRSERGGYEILRLCPRDNSDSIRVEVSDLSCHREIASRRYQTPQMEHNRAVPRSPDCRRAAAADAVALLDMAASARRAPERRRELSELGRGLRQFPLASSDAARLRESLRDSSARRGEDLATLRELTPLGTE